MPVFLKRLFLLLILLLVAGAGVHYSLYQKPGLFLWSVDYANGKFPGLVRTAEQGTEAAVTALPDGEKPAHAPAGAPKADSGSTASVSVAAPAKEVPPVPETPPKDPNEHVLFDGKTLGKWESIAFGGEGSVEVVPEGMIEVDFGAIMTGVKWTGELPAKSNYEINLDARKLDGNDFFCALTFPVKESHATFLCGGWGGGVVGISSVDDLDASENETMNVAGFEKERWYHIRVKVTDAKLEAWIDDKQMVDLELKDRKISLRPGDIELCVPLGVASFQTRAQYKNIVWRNLPATP